MKLQKIIILSAVSIIMAIIISGCGFVDPPKNSNSANMGNSAPHTESQSADFSSESNTDSIQTGTGDSSGGGDVIDGVALIAEHVDGEIRWNDVDAAVYEIIIDGVSCDTTTEHVFSLADYTHGVYSVEIRAYMSLGKGDYASAFIICVIRAETLTVTLQDRTLCWQAVNGAVGYKIYKDDAFITQISQTSYVAEEDGIYSVSVIFEDARLNSEKSIPIAVGNIALSAPTLTIEGSLLKWTEIPGAQMYFVCMGDERIATVMTNRLDIGKIYANKYKEDYPDGITVYVYAAMGDKDGPHSNTVTYKGN